MQLFLTGELPQLQKHLGQTLHTLSAQQNGSVLPVPMLLFFVDIFVGKVDAAR